MKETLGHFFPVLLKGFKVLAYEMANILKPFKKKSCFMLCKTMN